MKIKRYGCLIAVEGLPPLVEEELKRQLIYTHQSMEPDGRGRMKSVSEDRRLWHVQDDGALVMNCGFVPRIYRVVEQMGHKVESYERFDRADRVLTPDVSKIDAASLRQGQREMLPRIVAHEGGIIVSPTGTGKSYGIREICSMYADARILIAAPGIDAVGTLARYLRPRLPGQVGELGDGKCNTKRVTVSTFESALKVDRFNEIDILLVDEVHHAPAASYAEIMIAFTSPLKRFGFTATHGDRSDGADLVNEGLFGPVVMEVPYYVAVARGEIVPIHVIVHEHQKGPPYKTTKAMRQWVRKDRLALWRNGLRNRMIAKDVLGVVQANPDSQILVICSKIEHQAFLHRELSSLGLDFTPVTGNLVKKDIQKLQRAGVPIDYHWIMKKKRRGWLRHEFEEGRLKYALATEVWTKAISATQCEFLFYASGTGASNTVRQAAGRTSRTDNDLEGKVGTVIVYRDSFNKTYKARSDKLIRALKKEGHKITVVHDG